MKIIVCPEGFETWTGCDGDCYYNEKGECKYKLYWEEYEKYGKVVNY